MADRICSCCGESYTDEGGHDLDKCIETCASALYYAEKLLLNARDDLQRAYQRKIAQIKQALAKAELIT